MGSLTTLGEAMITFSTPKVGPLRYAPTADISMCGSEATVAIGSRRLGHTSSWLSRLGDDEPGELIRTRLLGEGVRVFASSSPEPTGLMLKEQPTAVSRRVHYYRAGSAATRLGPDDLTDGVIESSDIFHSSGITAAISTTSSAALRVAITRAKNADTLVSFDVNHRSRLWAAETARHDIVALLPDVDILFSSLDEAQLLLGTDTQDHAQLAHELHRFGPTQVVVTDGALGAWWDDEHGSGFEPATPTIEIDPFGAGDAFVAGYLSGLMDGLESRASVHQAALVASIAVGTQGDWEGLPTVRDLDRADVSIRR